MAKPTWYQLFLEEKIVVLFLNITISFNLNAVISVHYKNIQNKKGK